MKLMNCVNSPILNLTILIYIILIVLLNAILLAFPSSAKWENSRFLNKFFMGNVSKLPDVRFVIEIIYPYQILDLTFVLYDELVNGGLA